MNSKHKKNKECEIHVLEYTGSGTIMAGELQGTSDIGYKCKNCDLRFKMYLPMDKYLKRQYAEKILCEITPRRIGSQNRI